MKINLLLPALLLPTLVLAQGGAYTVQGRISPRMPVGKAYLVTLSPDDAPPALDSATVKKGRFRFRGHVAAPVQADLLLARPGHPFTLHKPMPTQLVKLYLEPGIIQVLSPDSLTHATLAGTPRNADQDQLNKLTRASAAQMQAVLVEWRKAPAEKRQDKAYEASIDQRYDAAEADNKVVLRQFVLANPASPVSLEALKQFGGYTLDPAAVGPLFDGLAPAVRQSKAGQEYAAKIEQARKVAVGALAPDFTQNDPTGKPVRLSDFRGKYVLVDFWASWCGPCRRENPNVLATYNQYKSRNFTVLGVSLDQPTGREAWLKAIAADGLSWTQVSDLKFWKNEAAQLYGIESIPQNFLIGPDGRIVAKNLRGDALGQKLAAVLPATAQ